MSGRTGMTRKPQIPSRQLPPSPRNKNPSHKRAFSGASADALAPAPAPPASVRLPPIATKLGSFNPAAAAAAAVVAGGSDVPFVDDEGPSSAVPHAKLNHSSLASTRARANELHKIVVFDVARGDIEVTNNRDTDKHRMVTHLHKQYQHNDAMKRQFLQVVEQMPIKRKKELAMETLARFHEQQERAMLARKMMPDAVSRHRANILKHLEIDRCFGELSAATSTLSAVRIASAAVDALLYHEAQKVADAQMKQRRALVLPEGVRPVDVLEMRLDAFRRQHVPFGPVTVFEK